MEDPRTYICEQQNRNLNKKTQKSNSESIFLNFKGS